nr:unnamed protein product [Naegleria fowleri]
MVSQELQNIPSISFWKGHVESTIIIHESSREVFEHLIDKKNYPIGMVHGWGDAPLECGDLSTICQSTDSNHEMHSKYLKTMKFPVNILGDVMNAKLWHWKVDHQLGEYCFGWKGEMRVFFGWILLFSGEHSFTVKPHRDFNNKEIDMVDHSGDRLGGDHCCCCTLTHAETFGGWFRWIFMACMKMSNFANHFSDFNKIVKERMELRRKE